MIGKEALKEYKEIYIDKKFKGDSCPSQEWYLEIIEQDLKRLEKLEIERFEDMLITEQNIKLKKVIKFLKDELGLYLEKVKFDRRKIFALMSKLLGMCLLNTTEENYDLLKEYLGNESIL